MQYRLKKVVLKIMIAVSMAGSVFSADHTEIIFQAPSGQNGPPLPPPWYLIHADPAGVSLERTAGQENKAIFRFRSLFDQYLRGSYICKLQNVKPDSEYRLDLVLRKFAGEVYLGVIHAGGKRKSVSEICWEENSLTPEFLPPRFLAGHPVDQPLTLSLQFKTDSNEQRLRVLAGLTRFRGVLEIESIRLTLMDKQAPSAKK